MHRIEAYITLGFIFVIAICILYLPILLILKKKGKSIIRQLSYVGLFCSVFLIIFATILFMPIDFKVEHYILNIIPFNWSFNNDSWWQFVIEKIPNILLFIPLGFFIPVVFKKKNIFIKTIIIAFITTFSVELFQYFVGRVSDIDDIITNCFGALIGYFIFKLFNHLFNHKKWWDEFTKNN